MGMRTFAVVAIGGLALAGCATADGGDVGNGATADRSSNIPPPPPPSPPVTLWR